MNNEVISFINESLSAGIPTAMVVLTESGRDTPGIPGSLMAVRPDGSQIGTIGGGMVEARIVADCQAALMDASVTTLPFGYSLGQSGELGMLCGGEVKGLITILRPQRRLLIFGGGHVGQKLYQAALTAGFDVRVVEDRQEFADGYSKEHFICTDNFHDTAKELSATGENYIVIVTRGHSHDYGVLSAVAESEAPYIGMIGSRHKVKALMEKLRRQGIPNHVLDKIYSPIGLDIDDGTPGEIAIGIMAEIIAVKNQAELRHCRDRIQ